MVDPVRIKRLNIWTSWVICSLLYYRVVEKSFSILKNNNLFISMMFSKNLEDLLSRRTWLNSLFNFILITKLLYKKHITTILMSEIKNGETIEHVKVLQKNWEYILNIWGNWAFLVDYYSTFWRNYISFCIRFIWCKNSNRLSRMTSFFYWSSVINKNWK